MSYVVLSRSRKVARDDEHESLKDTIAEADAIVQRLKVSDDPQTVRDALIVALLAHHARDYMRSVSSRGWPHHVLEQEPSEP